MAVVKTDALTIQIKNVDGSELNIHPDVLSIEPTLEAMPIYQLVRNTSFTRTNKLSFEYKTRAKSAFQEWKNDGSDNDPRKNTNGKNPVLEVIEITLTKSDIKWYREDIDKVDVGTDQFNSYIEQATVAILASIRDEKDASMFPVIEAGATSVDASGYPQIAVDGSISRKALPKGALKRVVEEDFKIFTGDATTTEGIKFSNRLHATARALMRIGAKGTAEEAFALATYGQKKANIIHIVDELAVDVLALVPNVLTSPKAYQDMFIDGELNVHKGFMMISAVRMPENYNFFTITKGIRGTVGLAEQSTKDMLFRVKEHPIAPDDYWRLEARQFWKYKAVEPHFAFVSKVKVTP